MPQLKDIGFRIKELGSGIFKNLNTPDKNLYELLRNQLDSFGLSEGDFFNYLGELFIDQNEINKNLLVSFIEEFGHKLTYSKATLDQSINFIYLTRLSIMGILEQEFRNHHISVDTYFESLKTLEYIYQLISKTLLNHYNEELSFTKFALDSSNEDLQITLKELADLQIALNEATILSISDKDDRITYVNDLFCDLFQYTREELIGKKHDIYDANFHQPSFFNSIMETIQKGEVWKGEILIQAKDGTKFWLDTTLIPFVDENGERYKHIAIQYDITEKKKTEETLGKAEKLSMIGELAAGIAHEIRNPLTTIRGFVQLLGENEAEKVYSNTILEEIERINFIVSEFMVFAKPHTVYFSECNLKQILGNVIKFLEPEALLKNVQIDCGFPEEEVVISGEKNQLKQVFLNLIKNGIEALPYGGKISISLVKGNKSIIIQIRDNGVGMDKEQVQKLGEPFFTTKDNGNGLGLMVSYKIIQNHKGVITVKSEPNIGTTFEIAFKSRV